MKIECEVRHLREAVRRVKPAATSKLVDILKYLHLSADQNTALVRATDLDREIVASFPIANGKRGEVCVEAKTLDTILNRFPAGDLLKLELHQDRPSVNIRCGRTRIELPTTPVHDFPAPLKLEPPVITLSLHAAMFRTCLASVLFAAAKDDQRIMLNGVYLHGKDNNLMMAASDGHRLAISHCGTYLGMTIPAILPHITAAQVTKLLDNPVAETVGLKVTSRLIEFTIGSVVVRSKVIDAIYPDYERVIPAKNDKVALVNTAMLQAAVERVSALQSPMQPGVNVTLSSGKLSLHVNNPDKGAADDEVEAAYQGEDTKTAFSSRYLQDIIDNIDHEQIEISFGSPHDGAIFRTPNNASWCAVLMPMRVH